MYSQNKRSLRIGFVVNPYAGLGGPLAQKGSDHLDSSAFVSGSIKDFRASQRGFRFLQRFSYLFDEGNTASLAHSVSIEFVAVAGAIGGDLLKTVFDEQVSPRLSSELISNDYVLPTTANDTKNAVLDMCRHRLDVLCFVGGDGTARDVHDALLSFKGNKNNSPVVLGIPAGVKMHSGVFAIDPDSAAQVLFDVVSGGLVSVGQTEVRDIDEEKLQKGIVNSKFYGQLTGMSDHQYIQGVKQGGLEVEELVLMDIAEEIRERMHELEKASSNCLYIFSPGTTTQFIVRELNIGEISDSTLLGFDVYVNGRCIAKDADESTLMSVISDHSGDIRLLIAPIGGQGHLVGRGSQQLSPACLKKIGRDRVWIVSTKSKLQNLNARPLLMDSNSRELDHEWAGVVSVITGYNDEVLYRLGME